MEESLCSQLISNLPDFLTATSAFLTFAVAAIVALITYKQFRLEREKFKLDLFDKRFAVFFSGERIFEIHYANRKD
jgi:hypothetical protein